MRDELATVLRLVADGRLSPEEAAPLIEALSQAPRPDPRGTGGPGPNRLPPPPPRPFEPGMSAQARRLRIRVTERGRQVVNLQIPVAFANSALRMVPGLSDEQAVAIREAIAAREPTTILDVEDEDGDGVVISME
jgi:hypothetical protein